MFLPFLISFKLHSITRKLETTVYHHFTTDDKITFAHQIRRESSLLKPLDIIISFYITFSFIIFVFCDKIVIISY